ncbi:hypothetical protein [Terriglobus sp.]|uniref:hypothetical protein n=1 Tax=Terriglobus sp. TaxID=1889013 RepID=UPI003B00001A
MSDFAAQALPLLRSLPVPLAALLLQQAQRYERIFPREQQELRATLQSLQPPLSAEMQRAMDAFAALRLSPALKASGWETAPSLWVERITAEMWSSGQIAAFRNAAKLVVPPESVDDPLTQPRAVVVAYDTRLRTDSAAPALFRRLRPLGTHYLAVDGAGDPASPDEWLTALDTWLTARAKAAPQTYAHWHISGGIIPSAQLPVATLSYAELQPARQQLLRMMNDARNAEGTGGPEGMRDAMRALTPQQMGLPAATDPVLRDFATDVLVGGSGTQLYATTFVQWTAREVLRRAQPRTLVARFTPRNQSASMDLRLSQPTAEPPLDPAGSLVDAEMGAHLTYVNLQRLPGAGRAHFLAWHPGYGQAVLIGRGVPAGAQIQAKTSLHDLLALMG